jgi:para-nitrobenzyl esterase
VAGALVDGTTRFRGVPYAAALDHDTRWSPPRRLTERWSEPRDACSLPPVPPQGRSGIAPLVGDPVLPQQESCLNLTVWTPPGAGPFPVLVWLPGGSFLTGTADLPRYDGAELAREQNIVVVLVSYRLGVLGFLAVDGATPAAVTGTGADVEIEATGEYTLNVGLLDQLAALRWVREEIGAFRGDPGQVSVVGQSAGGNSLAALLGHPSARSLIDRALLHSAPLGMRPQSREEADRAAASYNAQLQVKPGDLRSLPVEELLRGQVAVLGAERALADFTPPWQLVADDVLVPAALEDVFTASTGGDLELLIGTTRDECRLWVAGNERIAGAGRAEVLEVFGRHHPEPTAAHALYERGTPAETLAAMLTDVYFAGPAETAAAAATRAGVPVYAYRFDWTSPGEYRGLGACHCLDIPFVLGNPESRAAAVFTGASAEDMAAVRADMRERWGAFIRSGVPPRWARYPDYVLLDSPDTF